MDSKSTFAVRTALMFILGDIGGKIPSQPLSVPMSPSHPSMTITSMMTEDDMNRGVRFFCLPFDGFIELPALETKGGHKEQTRSRFCHVLNMR